MTSKLKKLIYILISVLMFLGVGAANVNGIAATRSRSVRTHRNRYSNRKRFHKNSSPLTRRIRSLRNQLTRVKAKIRKLSHKHGKNNVRPTAKELRSINLKMRSLRFQIINNNNEIKRLKKQLNHQNNTDNANVTNLFNQLNETRISADNEINGLRARLSGNQRPVSQPKPSELVPDTSEIPKPESNKQGSSNPNQSSQPDNVQTVKEINAISNQNTASTPLMPMPANAAKEVPKAADPINNNQVSSNPVKITFSDDGSLN